MSEKQVPMIPKHQAEKDAMHMTFAMKCIVIISVSFAVAMVLAIIIFVNGYTSRTKDWLTTISQLQAATSNVLRFPNSWTFAGGVFPPVTTPAA